MRPVRVAAGRSGRANAERAFRFEFLSLRNVARSRAMPRPITDRPQLSRVAVTALSQILSTAAGDDERDDRAGA